MILILVRHGKTEESAAGVILGQNPGTLHPEGVVQAQKTKVNLRKVNIDATYSSDLLRCKDTAEIITAGMDVKVQYDQRLREINFGIYQGKPYEALKEDYSCDTNKVFPGGESNSLMIVRVIDAINEIYDKHERSTVVVVTHSGPMSVIQAAFNDIGYYESLKNKADFGQMKTFNIDKSLGYPSQVTAEVGQLKQTNVFSVYDSLLQFLGGEDERRHSTMIL